MSRFKRRSKQPPVVQAVEVADAIVEVARPIILRRYAKSSCIAATAIVCDIMRKFKVTVRALPVRTTATNPKMIECLEEYGRFPKTKEETEEWRQKYGAWAVECSSLSIMQGSNDWAGHLVAVAAGSILVDLTVDQFATQRMRWPNLSESKGLWTRVPNSFTQRDEGYAVEHLDGLVMYRPERSNDGYRQAVNWMHPSQRRKTVREIMEAIGRLGRLR